MGWPTLLARDVSISRRPKTGRSVHLPYTRLTRRGASWRPKKTKQKNAAPSTFAACRPPSMGRHHASKPTKRTPPRLSDFPPDWPCLRKVLRWRYRARDTHRSPTGKKKETPMSHQRCDAITVHRATIPMPGQRCPPCFPIVPALSSCCNQAGQGRPLQSSAPLTEPLTPARDSDL